MNKKVMGITLLFVLIVGVVVYLISTQEYPENNTPTMEPRTEVKKETDKMNENKMEDETDEEITWEGVVMTGVLEDVSGGSATGDVQVTQESNKYTLIAEFQGLPELEEDFFYEGWIVRQGENLSVISTGEVLYENTGSVVNRFTAERDLADHDFYVLTLEPRDNDPEPAEHILEGRVN
jgi:hypothetical protein